MIKLDDTDRRLLRLLQEDATRTMVALAEEAGIASASCWRRIERLEGLGVIKARHMRIDPKALGFEVEVSLRVTLDKTQGNALDVFIAAARNVPEVNEIQTFLGRVDVRLNVLARDMSHYQDIYRRSILSLPHISDIEALMLVSNVKMTDRLPL
jgi:Lrp/AsnC family transcriptional regulator